MAITRAQIARQLLSLGGPVEAVNQVLGIASLDDIEGQTAMMPIGTMISGVKGIFAGKNP